MTSLCPVGMSKATKDEEAGLLLHDSQYPPVLLARNPKYLRLIAQDVIYMLASPVVAVTEYAHPAIAEAARRHSRVTTDPFNRTARTCAFFMAVVHGNPRQRAVMCAQINKQHGMVKGPGYSADDPNLQMWVLATFFWAIVAVHESLNGPMELELKTELCRDYGVLGSVLKIPQEMWPDNWDDFETYFNGVVDELVLDEKTKLVGNTILWNLSWPWFVGWVPPFQRMLVSHWMPDKLRVQYGLAKPNPVILWFVLTVTRWIYYGIPVIRWIGAHWLFSLMRNTAERVERTGKF